MVCNEMRNKNCIPRSCIVHKHGHQCYSTDIYDANVFYDYQMFRVSSFLWDGIIHNSKQSKIHAGFFFSGFNYKLPTAWDTIETHSAITFQYTFHVTHFKMYVIWNRFYVDIKLIGRSYGGLSAENMLYECGIKAHPDLCGSHSPFLFVCLFVCYWCQRSITKLSKETRNYLYTNNLQARLVRTAQLPWQEWLVYFESRYWTVIDSI